MVNKVKDSTIQIRLSATQKRRFLLACKRRKETPAETLRELMSEYVTQVNEVQKSRRK